MMSDIVTSLKLDKEFETSSVLVAKEINGGESSFLSSCLIGHCIKQKKAILFVSTHNNFSHYHNVGLRMNYNLQKCIDSESIIFYDLGRILVDNVLNYETCSIENAFSGIRDKLLVLKKKHNSVNVIIDGTTHFFDLGFSLVEVNTFCKDVIELITSSNNSFVLFHCNVATEDDVSCCLANLLSHKAQIVVEVESLASGWSTDVSGHLTIRYTGLKFDDKHTFILDPKPEKYLFKLFDRGVKLFAPGTV